MSGEGIDLGVAVLRALQNRVPFAWAAVRINGKWIVRRAGR